MKLGYWYKRRSTYLVKGKWLTVRKDHVRLPSGVEMDDYYILEYPDWATIIAITEDGKFVMERQYRHGLQQINIELCGGTVEEGEDPLETAKRELLEETGYAGGEWTVYAPTAPNPSAMTNICHTFIAKGVKKVAEQNLEKTEDIEILLMTKDELLDSMRNGEILQGDMLAPLWRYMYETKYKTMNILVTGGAGFIGSHLCRKLVEEGNNVVAVDNLTQGDIELIKDMLDKDTFTFIEADVFDSVKMQSIFKHNQFDMVYQLVANTSVQKGGVSPLLDIRETLSSTLEVLNYVAQYGVKKFMYASSSTVYGTMDEVMRESSAHLQPISFYGAAKLAGEAFASAYSSMYGIQMWVVRLSNVVGSDATHGIVHDIKEKLQDNKSELHLLGDGTQAKPFIHVSDAVDGILHAISKTTEQYNVIQVGNEQQISMRRVAEIVLEKMGLDTKIVFSDKPTTWAGDVEKYKYDVTKLRSLGWAPKWNTEEAIRNSVI